MWMRAPLNLRCSCGSMAVDARAAVCRVDPREVEWHLEGSGEKRMLELDLEKGHAGVDWSAGLLVVGSTNHVVSGSAT